MENPKYLMPNHIRFITMQIKRTHLRLVTYIQVLSHAGYLPSRYTPFPIRSF